MLVCGCDSVEEIITNKRLLYLFILRLSRSCDCGFIFDFLFFRFSSLNAEVFLTCWLTLCIFSFDLSHGEFNGTIEVISVYFLFREDSEYYVVFSMLNFSVGLEHRQHLGKNFLEVFCTWSCVLFRLCQLLLEVWLNPV